MTAMFNKLGISFQYPENWTLDEADALAGDRSVTVYSPGGAIWSVTIDRRATDPLKLAKTAVKAMREEYEGLESEAAKETIEGHEMVGYDLSFFYLDLTNTASVRCMRTELGTCTVFCEAEDREFERIRAVLLAMTTSLLRGLKGRGRN